MEKSKEKKYSKKQLKNANIFIDYKDIIAVVLDDDKYYTIDECKKAVDKFLKEKF